MNNKLKANAALAISAIGAALTVPTISPLATAATSSVGQFALGLLNHGFLAATIGGLADWFAVTALFRKPLGIGYRTEILKRNRQRIMEAIIDFVSTDLLSTKNIMDIIREENTAGLLADYLDYHDGRKKVKRLVSELLVEIAIISDTRKISNAVAPYIKQEASMIDVAEIVNAVMKVVTNDKHSRRILAFIFDAGQNIFKAVPVQRAVLQKITDLRRDYEGDSSGRAFVLKAIDLSDEKMLAILNENVDKKINATIKTLKGDVVDPDSITTAANMVATFRDFVKSMSTDVAARSFINNVRSFFTDNFNPADYFQTWLDKNLKGQAYVNAINRINRTGGSTEDVKLDRTEVAWIDAVERLVDKKIDDFINSPVQQDNFDRFVKKNLEEILNDYHDTIPDLIRERLDKLDDDQLTEFVESKVADDLQMIRINGSVCGACVGMFLYVVAWLIAR